MASSLPYDVFISYRQREPDMSWVQRALCPRLKDAGIRVFIDSKNFKIGAPLVTEMERGVKESRRTMVVATPAYLQSTFTEFENILAQHMELEERRQRVLVVMREHCELPLRLAHKLWLDMTTDEAFEDNLTRLVEALK
jgi:hypothetical protein